MSNEERKLEKTTSIDWVLRNIDKEDAIEVFIHYPFDIIRKKCIDKIVSSDSKLRLFCSEDISNIEWIIFELMKQAYNDDDFSKKTKELIEWYVARSEDRSGSLIIRSFRFGCDFYHKQVVGTHWYFEHPITRAIKNNPFLYWCDPFVDNNAKEYIDLVMKEKNEKNIFEFFCFKDVLTAIKRVEFAGNTLLIPKIEEIYNRVSFWTKKIALNTYKRSDNNEFFEKEGLIKGVLLVLKEMKKQEKPLAGLVNSFFKKQLRLKGMVTLHAEYSFVPDDSARNVIISFHLKATNREEEIILEEYLKNQERKEKQFYIIIDVFGSQDYDENNKGQKTIRFSDLVASFSYIPFGPQQKCFIRIFDEREEIADTCFYLEPDVTIKEIV